MTCRIHGWVVDTDHLMAELARLDGLDGLPDEPYPHEGRIGPRDVSQTVHDRLRLLPG